MLPLAKVHYPTRSSVTLPAAANDTTLPANTRKLTVASARLVVVELVRQLTATGQSLQAAIDTALDAIQRGNIDRRTSDALAVIKRRPSAPTLRRWCDAFAAGGIDALTPKHTGRVRQDEGWEALAVDLYRQPGKPDPASIAFRLRMSGHLTATDDKVRRYLQKIPTHLGSHSAARVGKHYRQQNLTPYHRRDASVLGAGTVWQGDGHCCDVYVAHPNTGNAYRPELTVFIDVYSRMVVGWWLSESESAITTLYALSHAIRTHDHVPAVLHVDPGSGYRNKLICDRTAGLLAILGTTMMFALPGNARGKGLVEGFFHHYEDRVGRFLPTFCGHDRTDDGLRRLRENVKSGRVRLPTLREFADATAEYVRAYNNTVQREQEKTPAQLFAERDVAPLVISVEQLQRPSTEAVVRSYEVRLHNRHYRSATLAAYQGHTVIVDYDLHDDQHVWIYDRERRFICEAVLVERKPWLSPNRIDDAKQQRLAAQVKRLDQKRDEAIARSRDPIDATGAQVLETLPVLQPDEDGVLKIDVGELLYNQSINGEHNDQ